jgi:hypothetical protein
MYAQASVLVVSTRSLAAELAESIALRCSMKWGRDFCGNMAHALCQSIDVRRHLLLVLVKQTAGIFAPLAQPRSVLHAASLLCFA